MKSHRPGALRYLLSFGLPMQECEELAQEVFLSLFVHLREARPEHNLVGWIFRVAHNLAIKRRQRGDGLPGAAVDFAGFDPHDPAPNAEQRLVAGQRRTRLRAVIAALAEQDRQCLFLRAEGLGYREIAAVVGISTAGVSGCLARALEKLRRADQTGQG